MMRWLVFIVAVLFGIRLRRPANRWETAGWGHPSIAATGYTHPALKCWICGDPNASQVVEGRALPQYATSPDEVESYRQLCCTKTFCLGVSARMANKRDMVFVDMYPLRTRAEAEAISGLDLGVSS